WWDRQQGVRAGRRPGVGCGWEGRRDWDRATSEEQGVALVAGQAEGVGEQAEGIAARPVTDTALDVPNRAGAHLGSLGEFLLGESCDDPIVLEQIAAGE